MLAAGTDDGSGGSGSAGGGGGGGGGDSTVTGMGVDLNLADELARVQAYHQVYICILLHREGEGGDCRMSHCNTHAS